MVNWPKVQVLCGGVRGYMLNSKDQEYCSTWNCCESNKRKWENKPVGQENLPREGQLQ